MKLRVALVVSLALAGCKTTSSADGVDEIPQYDNKLVTEDVVVGTGDEAVDGMVLVVRYTGTLVNGTIFDTNMKAGEPAFEFKLGSHQVIRGWDRGLVGMRVGGKRRLTVPGDLGYGRNGTPNIPPDSTLLFDVELLQVKLR